MDTKTNILFVCTENIHRSPTARFLYETDPDYSVRSRGTNSDLSDDDMKWADCVIVMEDVHSASILLNFTDYHHKIVKVLNIPDRFHRYDDSLIAVLKTYLEPILGPVDDSADRLHDARADWNNKTLPKLPKDY